MDSTDWIPLGQLITAILGIVGVIVTLRLNTRAVSLSAHTLGLNVDAQRRQADSDNRAHWWTRYTWAEDQRHSSDTRLQRLGWNHLDILVRSPLATATEAEIIQLIAIQRLNLPY